MANTTKMYGNIIEVTVDSDWVWKTVMVNMTNGTTLYSITFIPSAATDILAIKNGSDTGPLMFPKVAYNTATFTGQHFYAPNKSYLPVIDYGDCTFSNAANARIIFQLREDAR